MRSAVTGRCFAYFFMIMVTRIYRYTLSFLPPLVACFLIGCGSDTPAPSSEPGSLIPALAHVAVLDRFSGQEAQDAFAELGALGGRLLTRTGVQLLGAESKLLLDLDLKGTRPEPLVVTRLEGVADRVKLGGLAVTPDGRLWTVYGRTELARISAQGEVRAVEQLPFSAYAVYSWRETLLAQVARSRAGESPFMGRTGAGGWQSVGPLKTRKHASNRESLLWNTAHCGASRADLLPCWFLLGEPSVVLVDTDGNWTACPLALPAGAGGRVSDTGNVYPISFRDLFVSEKGEIIALTDTGAGDAHRGRFLGRYSLDGTLLASIRLNQGARQVLDVLRDKVTLLLRDDGVGEVTLP